MNGKMRKKKFAWRNVETNGWLDEVYNSSDDEGEDGMNDTREGDDIEFCEEVKINYKKLGEPSSTAGDGDQNSDTYNHDVAAPSSILDDEASSDSMVSSATSVMTTASRGAFGGPAGSILSYVMRDKKTVDLLSNKRSPGFPNALKRNIKRRKVTRRPEFR